MSRVIRLSRALGDERGISLLLTVLMLIPIFAVAALAVDLGHGYREQTRAQSAADAAATAAAGAMGDGAPAARDIAADLAFDNLDIADSPSGAPCGVGRSCYTSGQYEVRVTAPYNVASVQPPPMRVHVQVCRDLPTIVANTIGFSTLDVCGDATGEATITLSGGGAGPCGLCLLGSEDTTLSSTGSGILTVNNSTIQVNSSDSDAGKITGSGTISSTGANAAINIVGGYSSSNFSPTPTTGAAPVPDPLASLPVPSVAGPDQGKVSVSGSADITLNPGIYEEIKSSSGGQITLNPGIYVVTKEIKLSKSPDPGKTSLVGDNVLIYLACEDYPDPCEPGDGGAKMDSSAGTVALTGRTAADPTYQGMLIFGDRENTSEIKLTGSSASSLAGTIYGKSMQVSLTGPSGLSTVSSVIVANNLLKTGESQITIDFDAATNAPVFSPSVATTTVALVG